MTFIIPRPDWVSDALVADRGPNAGFQMYTRAGNDAVAETVQGIINASIRVGARRDDFLTALHNGIREVAKTHPEVFDTEPHWAVVDAVNAYFDTEGWAHISTLGGP